VENFSKRTTASLFVTFILLVVGWDFGWKRLPSRYRLPCTATAISSSPLGAKPRTAQFGCQRREPKKGEFRKYSRMAFVVRPRTAYIDDTL
jgi:hypothetical protein